jgi:hypothetical protein
MVRKRSGGRIKRDLAMLEIELRSAAGLIRRLTRLVASREVGIGDDCAVV